MFDALLIHLSEILRIGFLTKGPLKYMISMLLLLPIIILTTPFLIFSKKRFFIFTPVKGLNFYTKIDQLKIDLKNGYNLIEIDGDLIIIEDNIIDIKHLDTIDIVYK